jgi:pyrroline-5-carboxylate reductase
MIKVAFIGAGNMNSAIIRGLVNQGHVPTDLMVSNPSSAKRLSLHQQLGIAHTASNIDAAEFADHIVLGVKPHLITAVCAEISQHLDISNKCFISVAAGTTSQQIENALIGNCSVIRAMPNTPSQLALGVTGMFASRQTTKLQKDIADQLLSSVGMVKWLDKESDIDHIIAVSGSGPAYFFLFMEAMEKQAMVYGFSAEDSRQLVQQTALGAAQMVVNNDSSIQQLRENVTSKGGTTQAALTTFKQGNLQQLVEQAMNSALHKAQQMANNKDEQSGQA